MKNKDGIKQISSYKIYKKHIQGSNDTKDNNAGMETQFSNYYELNPEQIKIGQWLENLRFHKQILRGVSEYDVWKKIIELNAMYEEALKAERIRCNAIIDHYTNTNTSREVGEESEKINNE